MRCRRCKKIIWDIFGGDDIHDKCWNEEKRESSESIWGDMHNEHKIGYCDNCHKKIQGYGLHGIIHDINKITRLCNKCYITLCRN